MAHSSTDHNAGTIADVTRLAGREVRYTSAKRGNCYAASEALYHILGGKAAGWTPMRVVLGNGFNDRVESHWFLKHSSGVILDPAVRQFDDPKWWDKPDYSKAKGCGFLTGPPSKRARDLMQHLTWTTVKVRINRKPTRRTRGRRASATA